MLLILVTCALVKAFFVRTNCEAENGGNDSYTGVVAMSINAGWYYGVANFPDSPIIMYLSYNHPTNDPFIFTMVDAWCPGDFFLIDVFPPASASVSFTSFGANLDPTCDSDQYTTDPNQAITNPAFFGSRTITLTSGVYGPLVGGWQFRIYTLIRCQEFSTGFTIGYYARIDDVILTKTVCAFSSSSLTTQPSALPEKKMGPMTAYQTATTSLHRYSNYVMRNGTTFYINRHI